LSLIWENSTNHKNLLYDLVGVTVMITKNAAIATFLFIIMSCSLVAGVFAQQPGAYVGVSTGDVFKYDTIYNWKSTNPADTVPKIYTEYNQTDYLQVNVTATTGSLVIFQTALKFLNGSEVALNPGVGFNDVSIGNSSLNTFIYFYAANLSAGSPLFPEVMDLPWTINQTIFRNYGGNNFRATNHYNFVRTDLIDETYTSVDVYFDKETGVLVEANMIDVYSDTPSQTVTTHMMLTESSLWEISQMPTSTTSISPSQNNTASPPQNDGETPTVEGFDTLLIVLVVIFAVIIIIIIFILLTRRPKTARKPNVPPTVTVAKTIATTTYTSDNPGIIKCSNCGYENPEVNEFCGKCGNPLHK